MADNELELEEKERMEDHIATVLGIKFIGKPDYMTGRPRKDNAPGVVDPVISDNQEYDHSDLEDNLD